LKRRIANVIGEIILAWPRNNPETFRTYASAANQRRGDP